MKTNMPHAPTRICKQLLPALLIVFGALFVSVQQSNIAAAQATATVSVAHFAPFADSVDNTSVTVRVDGADAIADFKFGDVVNDVTLEEGDHLIEIVVGGSVALSGTVNLLADTAYTLAAVGGANGYDLMLQAFVKDTTPDPDNAKIFVAHLAPFDADIDATQVDICTDDNAVVLGNVPYLGATDPYVALPPGDYDLKIAVAGTNCETVALDIDSIRLAAGDIVDVFAIGLLTEAFPLQLQSTTGFTPTPGTATVSVAHFAPFADSVDNTSVTVRVDGADAIPDFMFGDVVNDVMLEEGDHLIEIVVGDSVALSGTVNLLADTSYTLAAVGGANGYDLMLQAFVKDTTPDPDNAKIFVAHLAPFNADIDATQVDICTDDNTVVLGNVPYLGSTDPYLTLPPGDYDLKIAVAGTNCETVALDIDSIRLAAGDIVDVFAIGLLTEAFPLQLQSTTGFTPTPGDATVVYVSSSSWGMVDGITFADDDILAYDVASDTWAKFFDGSDVGVVDNDVDAFTVLDDGAILMSFSRGLRVPGIERRVESSDIVKFISETLGEETSGTFEFYFDGADVGLTGWRDNMEDIDAIALDPQGRLVVSTKGIFSVPGIQGRDEDLVLFAADALGEETSGAWERYFDGSDAELRDGSEDVDGAWIDETGDIYLTTKGNFAVGGIEGDGGDIFICRPTALGASAECEYSFFWDSADARFGDENIDGFAIGALFPAVNSTVNSAAAESQTPTAEDADDGDIFDDENVSDSLHAADDISVGSDTGREALENVIFLPVINQ